MMSDEHSMTGRIVTAVLGSVLAAGCSPLLDLEDTPLADRSKPQRSGTKVMIDGDGSELGESERAKIQPNQLAERVEKLLDEGKIDRARGLVHRFPDVALARLRDGLLSTETDRSIAEFHGEQCLNGKHWPAMPTAYQRLRVEFVGHLSQGDVDRAMTVWPGMALGEPADPLWRADAWHLRGHAELLRGNDEASANAFAQAVRSLAGQHPLWTSHLLLLASNAQRRAGDERLANRSWNQAVTLAAEFAGNGRAVGSGRAAANSRAIRDPILWERAAFLQPSDQPWPEPVDRHLRQAIADRWGDEPPATIPTATIVKTCTGYWRLDRGEAQAALVALKQAETATRDAGLQGRLRLAQTGALLAMGQESAAATMLKLLAAHQDTFVSRPALARLGAMRLQNGSTVVGFNMLKKAVEPEHDAAGSWPGQAAAEADFGLAYLMIGDEEQGLSWLHRAQKRFEAEGDSSQLLASLRNEAEFFVHTERKKQARELEKRIARLEQAGGRN